MRPLAGGAHSIQGVKIMPTKKYTRTTPEQYKAMSPDQKRAFNKKVRAERKAADERNAQRVAKLDRQLIVAITALIEKHPNVELEIVSRYLKRNGYMVSYDPAAKGKGSKAGRNV